MSATCWNDSEFLVTTYKHNQSDDIYIPSRHTIKQRVERAEMKHPSSHTLSVQSTRLVVCVGMYMYKCMLELVNLYIYIYDTITDFDYSLQTHPDSRNAH